MAATLTLTDGTTTVNLAGSGASIVDYKPLPPDAGRDTVDETAVIDWASYTTGRSAVQSINRLFEAARSRQTLGLGVRVYVNCQLDGDSLLYRAEVIDGAVEAGEDTLGWNAATGSPLTDVVISWTRGIWEGPEASVPITNVNGSAVTSGLTVNNHSNSLNTYDAYFSLSGSSVAGDAPCPVRIELTTLTATALGYYLIALHRGAGSWTNVSTIPAEARTTGGTITSDANAHDGSYVALTVGTGELYGVMAWTIPGSMFNVSLGRMTVPLMRLRSKPANTVYFSFGLGATGAASGSDWVEVPTARQWVMFPPVSCPPAYNGGPYQDGTAQLDTRNSTGSSVAVDIDYVELLPVDGLRQYISTGSDVVTQSTTFVDDGIEGYVYHRDGSSNRASVFSVYGEPFMLYPGVDAIFVAHFSDVANNLMYPAHNVTARLYYRPRRYSI